MLDALYDHAGALHCWREDDGRMIGRAGENLAFIEGDAIYAWSGAHVAWWFGDHVRNNLGEVALFGAATRQMGVVKPVMRTSAMTPFVPPAPPRPSLGMRPLKPLKRVGWASTVPF